MRRWRSFKSCSLCIHGKACHTILRSLCSLTNRVPLPPLFRGQNKTPRNTFFINGSTVSTGYCATVEVLHRTSKWGEVRRLACPLRRFPFAAPPNCGGKVVAPATKGGTLEWYMKYMTLCCSPQISCFPLRWQGNWIRKEPQATENPVTRFPMGEMPRSGKRVYGAEQQCDTLSLSRPPRM